MNTYTRNLETQKLELHFEKSTYQALPDETKKKIKSNFLWSNYASAWVSRSKGNGTHWAEQVAKEIGLTYEGETGEKLTFQEQLEREQSRAIDRAERFEARSETAEKRSEIAFGTAHKIGSFIPMGQPILVGHHSERGHRADLNRIDNAMRKGIQEGEKSEYYASRAETAQRTADGEKFKSVDYLLNRISECNAELRAIGRGLEGKDQYDKETGQKMVNGCEISEERRARLTERRNEWNEKLEFFTAKLEEIGGGQMTAERLKEGKPFYAKVKGQWWPIKSINKDTITVLNWLNIASFTWKFKFDQIKATRGEGMAVVIDRDGNEVKPTVKY